MTTGDSGVDQSASWLKPSVEEQGLQRYIATIRDRRWLILATVVVATLVAVAYVATAHKVYKAEADLLITPVPDSNVTLTGLGLIHDSSDPTRDVQTAARVVSGNAVAQLVKTRLGDPRTPAQLLSKVSVEPVAQSNIVAVTAEAGSASGAQTLANAFARSAVDERTAEFHASVDKAIAGLRAQGVGTAPTAGAAVDAASPAAQLAQLEALRGTGDPTVRIQGLAQLPTSPVSPKAKLSIAAGLIAGLVLGIGGAFAIQMLDPRLRREEQLRTLYGLPILGRIPSETKSQTPGALPPEHLSPSTIEAYRTLRATLAASRRRVGSTSILVTSSSPSEGKSTSAINLASSLALAGNRVILIEADLRRPAVGRALDIEADHGTGDVLLEMVSLRDALVPTKAYGSYLQVLVADYSGGATGWMADRLFLPAARRLIDEAKELADYVIIDSPPLSEVIDALPLAQQADEVLVVVRLGKTHLPKLAQLSELLARHFIRPVGFAIVGARSTPGGYYYYAGPRGRTTRPKGTSQPPARETV